MDPNIFMCLSVNAVSRMDFVAKVGATPNSAEMVRSLTIAPRIIIKVNENIRTLV